MYFHKHYFLIFLSLSILFHPYSCIHLLTIVCHCCLAGLTVNLMTGGSGLSLSLSLACMQDSNQLWKVFLSLNPGIVIPLYVRVYEVLTKSFLFSLSLSPSLPLFLPQGLHSQRFNSSSPV